MKLNTDAIFKAVKENHARLQGCTGPHFFLPFVDDTRRKFFPDYKCQKCAGVMDSIHATHYIEGLKHALSSTQADVRTAIEIRESAQKAHYDQAKKDAEKA